MAIDPYDLDHPWDEERLQTWVLFGIAVANKPADPTAHKVEAFLNEELPYTGTPFQKIGKLIEHGKLEERLRKYRFGQYTRISRAYREVIRIKNILETSIEELETIHGIGQKTSRMIVLYWKPATECAPLDTHVLKWLRSLGYDAPKGTPSGNKYRELEKIFIREAKERGHTPKEMDEIVWHTYARPQKIKL